MTERLTFQTKQGDELSYKHWPCETATRAIVLLHRGHEHADRWDTVIPGLQMQDTALFAWDARGHGESPGQRGKPEGFLQYVRDLDDFFGHLRTTHGIVPEKSVVVAHSVGAVTAAAWVHDFAPRLAGLVLATPAFDVNLIVPGALTGISLLEKLKPGSVIKSYVKGSWLTRDQAEADRYDRDSAISPDISAKVLGDLFRTSRRVISDSAMMDSPLLMFSAEDDRVVRRGAIDEFYRNYGGEQKTHITLKKARHGIFHDLRKDDVCAKIQRFAERCFAQSPPSSLNADLSHPATVEEYADFQKPLTCPSLKGLSYGFQRFLTGTLGRLSKGVRIGHATGFDSGESLEYVYRNRAEGALGLGRIIDRGYLNAIGWQGIRQRRDCLGKALQYALGEVRRDDQPLKVVDIAGGAGRYLLDLLDDKEHGADVEVLCRDWSESALEKGRRSAAEMNLEQRITYQRGDAFDADSLAAVDPKPTIGIVSGLYELFPDNALLRKSLSGLYRAILPGGWLIYTNQPWHPQVEMIARTLTNRDGKLWVMRRRPQSEMDRLVLEAGFEKKAQWIDDFGIFTVSLARRIDPV